MRGERRRSRRECLRLLTLGGVGVFLTTGCAAAKSLSIDTGKLPELPLDQIAGIAAQKTPATSPTAEPSVDIASPASPTVAAASPTATLEAPSETTFVVGKTNGDGVYLRSSIQPEKKVKVWPDGTPMVVVGEDKSVGGRDWRNVRDPAGNVGWVPVQYLVASPKANASPSARLATSSPIATVGASSGVSPARWNVVDLDAFANGNIPLAADQLRVLGVAEIKGRAQKPAAAVLLRDLPRYYGTIVRLEGFVGLVQAAPADSPIVKLLGFGVAQVVVSCRDGTVVDVFLLATPGDVRVGDLVAVYGLAAGQSQVEGKLTGATNRLALVSKTIEKLPG